MGPTATGSTPSSMPASRVYKEQLDEDGQVNFKGKAKAFVRAYGFLASILPYTNAEWEKLSIFLNFLVPKLPAPVEEDLSKGILESIDMDSYRVEKKAAIHVQLADADAEIEPAADHLAADTGRNPNSTGSRTSSRPSTSSSGISPGRMQTEFAALLRKRYRPRLRGTPPIATPGKTPTGRTPGLSMTKL